MDHACIPYITGEGSALRNSAVYSIGSYGSLGVVLFFVLSGYCIAGAVYQALSKGGTPLRFARSRIHRIYPPYLAACLVAVFVAVAQTQAQRLHLIPQSNHHVNLSHGWVYWIANASITQIELHQPYLVIVFWSLCYEIVFYAMMGCLFASYVPFFRNGHISGARTIRAISVTIFSMTCVSLGWMIINPARCPFPLNLWYQFGIGALLFFAVIESASNWEKTFRLMDPRYHLGGMLFFLVVYAFIQNVTLINGVALHEFVLGKPSTRIQAATAVIFVLILLAIRPFDTIVIRHPLIRAFCGLGTISYSLYLIHTLIEPFVDAGFRRLGFSGSLYFLNYFAQVVFSIGAGFLFYRLVERHFISSNGKKRFLDESLLKER